MTENNRTGSKRFPEWSLPHPVDVPVLVLPEFKTHGLWLLRAGSI